VIGEKLLAPGDRQTVATGTVVSTDVIDRSEAALHDGGVEVHRSTTCRRHRQAPAGRHPGPA
jgi:hypothetical protein